MPDTMTLTTPITVLVIRPPAALSTSSPASLSEVKAALSDLATVPLDISIDPGDAADPVDRLLPALASAVEEPHPAICLIPAELTPAALNRLMGAIRLWPTRLRFSLCCGVGAGDEGILPTPPEEGPIVQIQWRVSDRLPELGFFRAFSRAVIWNHLDLQGRAATAENGDAIARQPNIIHSWEAVDAGPPGGSFPDVYHQVPPLPGRPLWRAVEKPIHRLALIERFGRDWLMRSRVDDGSGRLFRLGEALTDHYCPPDRLPDGFLDAICAMVAAGGTVAATHVRSNLERAYLIGYVLENGVIVGNSSLKNPRPEYIEAVRRQSGLDLSGFVERGYTSVRPEYRGLGIGTRLLAGLTARAGGRKIFSVIAEDNEATKIIARRNRTGQVATYISEKAGKAVGIWMPEWMIAADEKRTS